MVEVENNYKKYGLLLILVLMAIVLFIFSKPYLTGILGACTVYVLVRNQNKRLVNQRKIKKSIAALLITAEIILCCLIPAFLIIWLLSKKIETMNMNIDVYVHFVHHYSKLISDKIGFDLLSINNLKDIGGFLTKSAQIIFEQVEAFIVNSLVLVFVIYFMLLGSEQLEKYIYSILPFENQAKSRVINEIILKVKANAIGIPLLGMIQGVCATLGYYVCGVENYLFFGFITCFATIIPLIGTELVWVPLTISLLIGGHVTGAIGLVIYAILGISNIDNYVRFQLQKKLASTHPLVTVFGVVVGIKIFGFWGIIIGPVFFCMFFLCFDIFNEQYIQVKEK